MTFLNSSLIVFDRFFQRITKLVHIIKYAVAFAFEASRKPEGSANRGIDGTSRPASDQDSSDDGSEESDMNKWTLETT